MPKKIVIFIPLFILCISVAYFLYKPKNITVPPPVTTASSAAVVKSEKFNSKVLNFEITLPIGVTAEEKTAGKVVMIGDRILIYELSEDPEKCRGVCSVLTKKEDLTVNNIKMRYLEGYWEELGEDNAQSFVSFIIPRGNKYLVFMLQELPINSEFIKGRQIGEISDLDLNNFKKILESVVLF